jgi:protein gp37
LLDRFKLADPDRDELWTEAGKCKAMQWGWPLPNVWLGVSVEDQTRAEERIPDLLATPAAKRFLSCEPLLGPMHLRCIRFPASNRAFLDATNGRTDYPGPHAHPDLAKVDWVICGGESGPNARPMNPGWARLLRDQCQDAGVPFFFKQWGEWQAGDNDTPHGLQYYRVGKKAAGAMLDGREWREFPA